MYGGPIMKFKTKEVTKAGSFYIFFIKDKSEWNLQGKENNVWEFYLVGNSEQYLGWGTTLVKK